MSVYIHIVFCCGSRAKRARSSSQTKRVELKLWLGSLTSRAASISTPTPEPRVPSAFLQRCNDDDDSYDVVFASLRSDTMTIWPTMWSSQALIPYRPRGT